MGEAQMFMEGALACVLVIAVIVAWWFVSKKLRRNHVATFVIGCAIIVLVVWSSQFVPGLRGFYASIRFLTVLW